MHKKQKASTLEQDAIINLQISLSPSILIQLYSAHKSEQQGQVIDQTFLAPYSQILYGSTWKQLLTAIGKSLENRL